MKIKLLNGLFFGIFIPFQLFAQNNYDKSKFHQLEDWWPTANEYRNGAGAPGHAYWQQKVDYVIDVASKKLPTQIIRQMRLAIYGYN